MKRKLFFLLLFLAPFAFISAQTGDADADAVIQAEKGIFEWSEETHDFGQIDQGIPVTHKFTFKNVGSGPLTVKDVKRTCGCTVTNWSKEVVPPGGEGFVEAQYNAAAMGTFNKGITVESDTDTPFKTLYFKGEVLKKEQINLNGNSILDAPKQ